MDKEIKIAIARTEKHDDTVVEALLLTGTTNGLIVKPEEIEIPITIRDRASAIVAVDVAAYYLPEPKNYITGKKLPKKKKGK